MFIVTEYAALKVKTVQSQSYSSTSKVLHCEKVYFAPLASFIWALLLHLWHQKHEIQLPYELLIEL